jgi:hypothetical protein
MTTLTIAELFDKRAEIAGNINQLEKRTAQLRADLAHIEAAIRILRPGTKLEKVVPKRVEYRARYFKKGQLRRLCMDYVRQRAPEAVTVTDVLPVALQDRGLGDPSALDRQRLTLSVYQSLYRLRKRGLIEQIGAGPRGASWRLASDIVY